MGALAWYDWILLIVSIALILIIVLQNSKGATSNAFSGEKSDLFANQKARGPEKVINRVTTGLSIAFFVLALVVSIFGHSL